LELAQELGVLGVAVILLLEPLLTKKVEGEEGPLGTQATADQEQIMAAAAPEQILLLVAVAVAVVAHQIML
jgi:hypothetical protein